MKYVKKPIPIEAIKYEDDGILSWLPETIINKITPEGISISTLEGDMLCRKGDYILKGTHGEYYPVKSEIFEETYEKADEPKVSMDCCKAEPQQISFVQALEILDELLHQMDEMPSRGSVELYDTYANMIKSIRKYQSAILLCLYDDDKIL